MALITRVSDEVVLDSVVNDAGPQQVWIPSPVVMTSSRIAVMALVTDASGTDYARCHLLDQAGNRIVTTDLPWFGGNQASLIALDSTHLLETNGTDAGIGPGGGLVNTRRITVADTGFSVDWTASTPVDASELHESKAYDGMPQVQLPTLGVVLSAVPFSNQYYPSQDHGFKVRAVDTVTGSVLWTYRETLNIWAGWEMVAVQLEASGEKATASFVREYGGSDPAQNSVWTREYTITRTGCTPTGDAVLLDSGDNGSPAAYYAMSDNPYEAGAGYIAPAYPSALEFTGRIGATQQCTTGLTTSGDMATWPYNRPLQSGLFFSAFGYLSFAYPDNSSEGVRTVCWNPQTSEIECTEPLYLPTVGGVLADSTWYTLDEMRGGGCTLAFDPGTGVGVLTVGWLLQQTSSSPQILQASAWIVQGPGNTPNLTATLQGVEVHFAG